ncbi:unnamed protein product [Prunus armeniaca]
MVLVVELCHTTVSVVELCQTTVLVVELGQTTVLVVERGQTTVLVFGLGSSLVAIYFSSLTRVGLWAHWSMSLASVHMRLIYVVFTQRTSSPNEIRMFQDHQEAYLNGVVVRGGLGCSGVPVQGELVCSRVPL